jgi:hypothetical protein
MEIYAQVQHLILAGKRSADETIRLTRKQGGLLVRIAWIGQVYRHIPKPKTAYVCPWEEMNIWEQETDCDIYQEIEKQVLQVDL